MPGVEGKVVLITGASRGIGKATARLFSAKGAHVMAVARSSEETVLLAGKTSSLPYEYFAADLSTEEGCQVAVDETVRRFNGRQIDILVCNHGIGSAHEKPIHELENVAMWNESINTNLHGPFYLTRLVMSGMVQNKYGRCVYTSSTAATDAGAEYGAVGYNASKAGLLGLMRSVCRDGGIYNITANAVLPGWVKTEMADKSAQAEAAQNNTTAEQVWEERAALYPPKRVVTQEEVAHTILFLASEESSGVSGEEIRVSLGCPL